MNHMQAIKPRSMMTLPSSSYPMCFSSLSWDYPYILWLTNVTRAGIRGSCLHLQAASTCSVKAFTILKKELVRFSHCETVLILGFVCVCRFHHDVSSAIHQL